MHAKRHVRGQAKSRNRTLRELLSINDHHLGATTTERTLIVRGIVDERDDPTIVLRRASRSRHEEGLHGELSVTRHPLLLVVELITIRFERRLGERLHRAVDTFRGSTDGGAEVHVLVRRPRVVPASNRELARNVA